MNICSYFRSASKSSVVSSSSDSEDGNEPEIDVQPNPPKKHCSGYFLIAFLVRIWNREILQKVGRNFSLVRV